MEGNMLHGTGTGTANADTEIVDVLIVGAGISGIGAAYHLRQRFPERTFAVVDALDGFGGTWRIHRYPGARSDSDRYTYGYSFKPWSGPAVATAGEIRDYLGEVIEENDLAPRIRYGHKVRAAQWSSAEQRWTVDVTQADTGRDVRFTAKFLWMCQGYYRHEKGYTPDWPGIERYQGTLVHPQQWPEGLDYAGKRVVVIGSGATAATIVPALAQDAAHVTMLQRTPTFYHASPRIDDLAQTLTSLDIPAEWTYEILRRKYIGFFDFVTQIAREDPEAMRKQLIEDVRALLPEGFDVETHFTPPYRPWQQRIAIVPDGDLFAAIREGAVSVVTGAIEEFDETGVTASPGGHLDADIIVTATGFDLGVFGEVAFSVDGEPVDFSRQVTYRGIMITEVPNMAFVKGYFRSSWTLRLDMVCDFVCRLLAHLDELGKRVVVPRLRPDEASMPLLPWSNPENFSPGYILRTQDRLFKTGDHDPWMHLKDYPDERDVLPAADLDDGALQYS